jgi:hypothetical protein
VLGKFSEFSYGFALAHEICNRSGTLKAAPVLPSLVEEGRAGGGYDFRVDRPGLPLFLQFKLSEYMQRSYAGQWDQFGEPYYRFWIHARRHSDQHDLLLTLDDGTAEVLYAAPRFHEVADLNTHFSSGRVEVNSIFFAPSEIGSMPDDEQHPLAFEQTADHGFLYSEPKRISARYHSDGLAQVLRERLTDERARLPTAEIFQRLFSKIVERKHLVSDASFSLGVERGYEDPLLAARARAAVAARTLLGAELLWLTAS